MIILFNGHVGFSDPALPARTAIAIDKDRITTSGRDEDVLNLADRNCIKIDLHGKTVWPGLTDSHIHLEALASKLRSVDCATATRGECLSRVGRKAASLPDDGSWILGNGWNQNLWQDGFGTASELDAVSQGHPVFLHDQSLHSAWVNSTAIQMAHIDRQTPDPLGGQIRRTEDGCPTGILHESAVSLVEKIIPAPSSQERLAGMKAVQAFLHGFGITAVSDFDPLSCHETLLSLHTGGDLKLRVVKNIPRDALDWAIGKDIRTGAGDETLRWGWLKLFADGALGPQTAAMLRPYETDPANFGQLLLCADDVFDIGIQAVTHGLSLAIHAIGDRATHEVLSGYGMLREYQKRSRIDSHPHRIEHLQLLHPDDLEKAAQLGVIASMQPVHVLTDMFTADKQWGTRSRFAYAFRSLTRTATEIIFGSDAPVESPDPFLGMYAAVTRKRLDGLPDAEGWFPSERLPLQAAFAAYTFTPAHLFGFPSGLLNQGDLADIIILGSDPEKVTPEELPGLRPERVMFSGEWVTD